MLTQIYEVTSPEEAEAISAIGVDHIGVLVGDGQFPREQPLEAARRIAPGIKTPSKLSALFLSDDPGLIAEWASALRPAILHLGTAPELMSPAQTAALKARLPNIAIMRSVPVTDESSVALAEAYEGIADFLLLDTRQGDQIGALGLTHDWDVSRCIVESVKVPVVLAGGLGPDNVSEAIRRVVPAGVDSKTLTDRAGTDTKDLDKVRAFHQAAKLAVPGIGKYWRKV